MRRTFYFLLGCILLSFVVQAQQLDLQRLQFNGTLPEGLLNTRSVVLVRTSEAPAKEGAEPWKELARQAHPFLRDLGVDAVAYYDWRNVNAGPDATIAFGEAFRQRAIKNVVVVEKKDGNVVLSIAPIGEEVLLKAGSPAWQQSGAEMETVFASLKRDISKASLELGNFLIIDLPEFFYTTDIQLNKRFFSYGLDLNLDKLAVPAYDIFVEENQADSLADLKRIMQNYPYAWGITNPSAEGKDLRLKEGYQYELLYLHTSAANIRRFLNYGADNEIPLELQADTKDDQSVYKFYIRHIYTGDVYAGTHWDAAPSWEEALKQHIEYLRKAQAANIK
ncbi:hypothetical protein [Nafulsella turpanensis]|uniref:hypothetical protein n=1 Tax=Nafulsella turpanensis TaxID=1265690 RepID=UPI00034958F3|nr:hypothetical protein [Nafulsella turpanensis]